MTVTKVYLLDGLTISNSMVRKGGIFSMSRAWDKEKI